MIRRFLAAIQFLTVMPISGDTATPGQAAVFFPLAGAILGALAGAVCLAASVGFPHSVAALLTIAFLLIATGCLHEDGLADVADAIRAGRTRERMLAILKDSRIGTYGALALGVSLLLRWQSVALCRINPVYGIAAALGLSRSALVILAAISQPVGEGLGREFASAISRPVLATVAVQACLLPFLAGWAYGSAMLLSSAVIILVSRAWFARRLGGVNGDCLGAACQAVETVNLVILSWRHSF
jgi:adenosylcobinamide-GDP ribazoletransferase